MVGSIALSKSFRYFYVAHAAPVAPAAAVALLNLHVWPLVEQAAVVPHPQSPVLRQILCRLPDMAWHAVCPAASCVHYKGGSKWNFRYILFADSFILWFKEELTKLI